MQEHGHKGICFNCLSIHERDAISNFVSLTYPSFYFDNFIIDDDSLDGLGNADLPQAELWLPHDADQQPLFNFLATIPPRTVEFSVDEVTEEMEQLINSVNSLVIEYEDDIEFDTISYLISMEDQPVLIRQLKEMAL